MSVLLDLAARCEAASGPDRELDAEIGHALKMPPAGEYGPVHGDGKPRAGERIVATLGGRFAAAVYPQYTASLDAAMMLVPSRPFPELRPGEWWWSVDSLGCDAHVAYENHDSGIPEYSGAAATPALALCAAALRARAAGGDQ